MTKNSNFQNYLKLATQIIAFKSISTDPQYKDEIQKTVNWLKNLFSKNGFLVEIWPGKTTNPVVFASFEKSKDLKTVLVYGHYDVQPAKISDGWKSDPFRLRQEKGKLFGRGVVDNKGQILIHIATVIDLINNKNLGYNLLFLIEGNEETSNSDFAALVKKNKKKLKTDYILISDGEANYKPYIETSLRGGFNTTVKYTSAKNNLHSGIYGGAVPNAAHELSKLTSKFYDENNKVAIPGFYDNVDKITPTQIKNNKKLLKSEKEIFNITGSKKLLLEKGYDFFTQIGARPTIQVTGIKSGYIDEGYANIIPSTAEVRVNFRIVTSQDPYEVFSLFKDFVAKNTPMYLKCEVSATSFHKPIKIKSHAPIFSEVKLILEKAFDEKVLFKPVGGAIPVVSDFKEILGIDTLLISLGNDDCNMHGTDENFDIEFLKKGLVFSRMFFKQS